MSKKCDLTGKMRQRGNRVSHAKNRTKHDFDVNIQKTRVFIPSLGKSVRMNLSVAGQRIIDKMGVEAAFKKYELDIKSFCK